MSGLDFLILTGFISLLLVIGLTVRAPSRTIGDYFLAGRELRWWQIGFSLFATNFSAAAIIGLTGAAYLTGIAIYNYEWVGVVAMIVFAVILVQALRKSNVYTIAQYLEERFDGRVKVIYSAFLIFLIIFIEMASALYAGGILLKEVFPGLSINLIIFFLMVLAGIYSVVGGMRAISRTDILQSIVVILGAVLVSVFTFRAAGGWQAFLASTSPESLSLIRGPEDRAMPWTGLVTGVPILCLYFWLVNQNMVQWVLSAKSVRHARQGLVMAGFLKILVLFIIVLPGLAAVMLFPDLAEPDRVYPALLFELLPAGVLGLVLAGFVSAIMSNSDSTLHAASTIITMDFVKKARPEMSVLRLVWAGRISTFIIILVSALWAPIIGQFGTLFEYVQGLLSFAVAPFVTVYLAGWFWPRANATGALVALVSGIGAAIVFAVLQFAGLMNIHYLHVPLPVTVVSLTGLVAGSLLTPAGNPEARLLVGGKPELTRGEILSLGALGMALAVLVVAFA